MALTDKLSAIGDAIREKTGGTTLIALDDMPEEIASISGGGEIPSEALVLTGDCAYRFATNGWNWFIDEYGDRVATSGITIASNMFLSSTALTEIPFSINLSTSSACPIDFMFSNCGGLTTLPNISGRVGATQSIFQNCRSLRNIPNSFAAGIDWSNLQASTNYAGNMFSNCYSLRSIAPNLLSNAYSKNNSSARCMYSNIFQNCYCLDEVTSLAVVPATITADTFSNSFTKCSLLKRITFEMDNGVVKSANWKSQTINLTNCIGYTNSASDITNYNSGVTADKRVTDAASYEALKNDPNWFTTETAYSHYNHDSAVETINSLPDTSVYLATAGGTNTIKFKGLSGSLTDGGAINTLTSEEIAVATAKGWTVTLT